MKGYIVKRMLRIIPLVVLITLVSFFLMSISPYDAIDTMITPDMSKETVALLKENYGYNKSWLVQYLKWLIDLVHGDFGYSIISQNSIRAELETRIINSLGLAFPSYLCSLLIAIPAGMKSGSSVGSNFDKVMTFVTNLLLATPSFWLATIAIYIFSYYLNIFPLMGMGTIGNGYEIIDFLYHATLPFLILTISFIPETLRLIRALTIDELAKSYVENQIVLGNSKRVILKNHVLPNIMAPIIIKTGMALPLLVTGSMIIETVFGWPGTGPYFVKAVQNLDYPVVMIMLLLSSILVILGNLFSDILQIIIDPRKSLYTRKVINLN